MHDYDTAVENKHLHMNNTHPFNGALSRSKTVSGSGISSAMCKSATRSRQITMPTPHHCFLQAGCPSFCPTNSMKALKVQSIEGASTEGARE